VECNVFSEKYCIVNRFSNSITAILFLSKVLRVDFVPTVGMPKCLLHLKIVADDIEAAAAMSFGAYCIESGASCGSNE